MKTLKAKDLIALLQKAPPNSIVVCSGPDHSYRPLKAEITTAMHEGDGRYSEDFGQEITPDPEHGNRVDVILIA